MERWEVVVEGELFRISERTSPGGAMTYDFAWLNGPAEGTYGFSLGRPSGRSTEEELVAAARGFVKAFYEPGGIGETDFPNHPPAIAERNDGR